MNERKKECVGLQRTWVSKRTVSMMLVDRYVVGFLNHVWEVTRISSPNLSINNYCKLPLCCHFLSLITFNSPPPCPVAGIIWTRSNLFWSIYEEFDLLALSFPFERVIKIYCSSMLTNKAFWTQSANHIPGLSWIRVNSFQVSKAELSVAII